MSADWKEGDLAVCIADGWHKGWAYNPKVGDVLRVAKCGLFFGELALGFEGKPLRHGWNADAFRKAGRDDGPCRASRKWLKTERRAHDLL